MTDWQDDAWEQFEKTTGFNGAPLSPEYSPEVQELAKVIAKVIHPSYRQDDHVFHRKAINTAVAVLRAGYRKVRE